MSLSGELVFKTDEIEIYRSIKGVSKWQTFKLIFKFHPEKGKFSIGWNGSRFSAGYEFDKLNKFFPETLRHLEIFLNNHYSDGSFECDSAVLERDWIEQIKAGQSDRIKAHGDTERKQQLQELGKRNAQDAQALNDSGSVRISVCEADWMLAEA